VCLCGLCIHRPAFFTRFSTVLLKTVTLHSHFLRALLSFGKKIAVGRADFFVLLSARISA
jgi:hypothetical protein